MLWTRASLPEVQALKEGMLTEKVGASESTDGKMWTFPVHTLALQMIENVEPGHFDLEQ